MLNEEQLKKLFKPKPNIVKFKWKIVNEIVIHDISVSDQSVKNAHPADPSMDDVASMEEHPRMKPHG